MNFQFYLEDSFYFVLFFSQNCPPCRHVLPIFEELKKEERFNNVVFLDINVNETYEDHRHELINKYEFYSIPYIIIIDKRMGEKGEKTTTFTGIRSKSNLENFILQTYENKLYVPIESI